MISARFLLFFLLCLLVPAVGFAAATNSSSYPPSTINALIPMDEAALDDVQGRSGTAIFLTDIRIYNETGRLGLVDTSEHKNEMALAGISSFSHITTPLPIMVSVYENRHGIGMLEVEVPDWRQNLVMDVETFEFLDEDLGSLHLRLQQDEFTGLWPNQPILPAHPLHWYEPMQFRLYLAPLSSLPAPAGTHPDFEPYGIGFQFETRMQVKEFRWNYNTADDNEDLRIGDFQVAGSFDPYAGTGAPDLYEDWNPQGRLFVGKMSRPNQEIALIDYNPAAFYMATETIDKGGVDEKTHAFARMHLPMEGSIRINNVEMTGAAGRADLGPVFIDGMKVHHLQVDFRPFDAPWGP